VIRRPVKYAPLATLVTPLVLLESNYLQCKTTKQIFYNSTGCGPGAKKLKAESLSKISEDHRQASQQLMHLRKVCNCPLSCQNTRNYLLWDQAQLIYATFSNNDSMKKI